MTLEVKDKSISLTEVKPIKNGREKQGVKNVVKLNFLPPPKKHFLYAHSFTQTDHSKFKNNTRKEEFQNYKTIICWKKEGGSKIIEEATINFNVTTNVTVLVSNI